MTAAGPSAERPPAPSETTGRVADLALSYGFPIVLLLVTAGFAIAAPGFLALGNLAGIAHAMVPITVVATGMAVVVMLGKLDISLGSIAFCAMAFAALAMRSGAPPPAALALALGVGAGLGALNGFVVTVLRVNPLIATLGAMIAYRGLALQVTDSQVIVLPDAVRAFGNLTVGPVFADTLIALALLGAVHVAHRRTVWGRDLTAIGNDEAAARRVGLPVRARVFSVFVLAGTLGAAGGILAAAQTGSVTTFLGSGMEFTAVAVVVVGGISLFGGSGHILAGVLLGAATFEVIRAGLNHVGANPYSYQLVGGAIIFVAMFAFALRERRGVAPGH